MTRVTLMQAIDIVNEHDLFGRRIPADVRSDYVSAITGSFSWRRRTFVPAEGEVGDVLETFTGERVRGAPRGNIVRYEALRALTVLRPADPLAKDTLRTAGDLALSSVYGSKLFTRVSRKPGIWCCPTCTSAFWRFMTATDWYPHEIETLENEALETLRNYRRANGTWRGFPFYYAVLSLIDFRSPLAKTELRHAAARLEAVAKRGDDGGRFAARRVRIAEKVLAGL